VWKQSVRPTSNSIVNESLLFGFLGSPHHRLGKMLTVDEGIDCIEMRT